MEEIVIERFGFGPAQNIVGVIEQAVEDRLGVAFRHDVIRQGSVVGALVF